MIKCAADSRCPPVAPQCSQPKGANVSGSHRRRLGGVERRHWRPVLRLAYQGALGHHSRLRPHESLSATTALAPQKSSGKLPSRSLAQQAACGEARGAGSVRAPRPAALTAVLWSGACGGDATGGCGAPAQARSHRGRRLGAPRDSTRLVLLADDLPAFAEPVMQALRDHTKFYSTNTY